MRMFAVWKALAVVPASMRIGDRVAEVFTEPVASRFHPMTLEPSLATRKPSLLREKLPAREKTWRPSEVCSVKKPLPWMAMSRALPVLWKEDWLKSWLTLFVCTPRPNWMGLPLPWVETPPRLVLKMSRKVVLEPLNPTVLMFDRLLPITFSALALVARPERPE